MLLLLHCMFIIIVLCLLYHCTVYILFVMSIVYRALLKTSLLTDAVFPLNSNSISNHQLKQKKYMRYLKGKDFQN